MEQTHSLDASHSYGTTSTLTPYPSQRVKQPNSLSTCIYGDVLRRMMAFLNCSSINEVGQMNRAWTQMILSKDKTIPWINIKTSVPS